MSLLWQWHVVIVGTGSFGGIIIQWYKYKSYLWVFYCNYKINNMFSSNQILIFYCASRVVSHEPSIIRIIIIIITITDHWSLITIDHQHWSLSLSSYDSSQHDYTVYTDSISSSCSFLPRCHRDCNNVCQGSEENCWIGTWWFRQWWRSHCQFGICSSSEESAGDWNYGWWRPFRDQPQDA